MRLTQMSLKNPLALGIIAVAMMLVGIISMLKMPAQLLPAIEKPVIGVPANWPGASPAGIESELTVPLQEALSGTPGVVDMNSWSFPNNTYIQLTFASETNMTRALIEVISRMGQLRSIPVGAHRPSASLGGWGNTNDALITYYIQDSNPDTVTRRTNSQYLRTVIVPRMQSQYGVGSVTFTDSASENQLQVVISPAKAAALGIDISKIPDLIGRSVDASLVQAETNVARLIAEEPFRQGEVRRLTDLRAKNAVPEARLEEALANRDRLMADISAAKAQLVKARGDRTRAELRAPYSGVVAGRLASLGEYKRSGDGLVRLVSITDAEISFLAPIPVTPFLTPGAALKLTSHFGESAAPIRTILPVGDAVSRLVEVRLTPADVPWPIGTAVRISVPTQAPEQALMLPRDAVTYKRGKNFFYRVGADGKAEEIEVLAMKAVDNWVRVETMPAIRLAVGDRVVIRGAERLGSDQTVEILSDNS